MGEIKVFYSSDADYLIQQFVVGLEVYDLEGNKQFSNIFDGV